MTTFAEGRERNTALGIYGAAAGSGAAVGVLLGGVLTSYLSWPWIFFINVPVALAAIALTPLLLRESRAENALRHFDVAGATSITAGLMLLVYALTRATTDGWTSPATIGLLAASAVLVLSFIVIELRSKAPLLPLRIFRIRSLAAANVAMVIIGSATFAEFFLLTLYLQDVLHYTAVQTGVAFSGFAISVVVASNLAQAVVSRFGIRATLTTGIAASALSVAWLTRLPIEGHYFWDMFPAFVLGGLGLGFSFVPLTIASLAGVERADAGIASGLVNTSRQMGGAIGLAAMSAIAATSTANYADAHPGVGTASAAALDHGFQTTLYVLTGLLHRRCRHRRRLDQAATRRPGAGAPGRARRPEGGSMTTCNAQRRYPVPAQPRDRRPAAPHARPRRRAGYPLEPRRHERRDRLTPASSSRSARG